METQMTAENRTAPKIWNCGHTEDQHNFADVMFCIRDPHWFKDYQEERRNRPLIPKGFIKEFKKELKADGKTSQKEFRETKVLGLFKALDNTDQESIYYLIWSLTAKDLLYKIAKDRETKFERGELR